jgi:hypothetical protein
MDKDKHAFSRGGGENKIAQLTLYPRGRYGKNISLPA